MCDKDAADRTDARLRAVRRRGEEAAARASVFRHQGGAGASCSGKRAASSGTPRAAARASSWCCWPSGSWRTTRTPASLIITDRDELDKQIEGVFSEAGETINRTSSGQRPDDAARPGHAAAALLAGPQVRPQGRGRLRCLHQGTGSPAQPDRGRSVRLRGRVPPHAERQAAPRDEGDDAQRGVHRLHRHAAAEEGQADQPRGVRRLHPHLQIQRGGRGRGGARPRL